VPKSCFADWPIPCIFEVIPARERQANNSTIVN
jgi:hypothetical protein